MIYSKLEDGTIFCHTNKKMYRNYEEFSKDGLYELQQKVEQLENIRKEAIEYIENTDNFDIEIFDESTGGCLGTDLSKGAKDLLNILNKGE